jgi:hypothetical protein
LLNSRTSPSKRKTVIGQPITDSAEFIHIGENEDGN